MTDPFNSVETPQNKVCFVVMPQGRTPRDAKWFKGWYEVAIEPAITDSGFKPVLAAAADTLGALNDTVRAQLTTADMVICNLAGLAPEDLPNPSVMYALGFRQALQKPVIIMAWRKQVQPLDISQQCTVTITRDVLDVGPTRKKIAAYLCGAPPMPDYSPEPEYQSAPRPMAARRPAPPPLPPPVSVPVVVVTPIEQDEELLAKVTALLPAQPWPRNIHKTVATTLGTSNSRISHAIQELVKRGKFLPQTDGQVAKPEKPAAKTSKRKDPDGNKL